jgi:CRP-like cAMP-binding protein
VTKLIGLRRKRVERRLRSLLFRSNRDRLAHLLLELVEQYGRTTHEGVLLDIKLSHQELSSIIGATRETVTTLLGEMQLDGLLKVSRQKVVVRDLRRLAADQGTPVPKVSASSPSAAMSREFQLRSLDAPDAADP